MRNAEDVRRRLAAVGVELPDQITALVVTTAGPLVTALDDLATLDLGNVEPFEPARRLPDDAGR